MQAIGVETLAIVATEPERAQLYFRFHPARVPLAADPAMTTHRSYGLIRYPATSAYTQKLMSLYTGLARELHEPVAETASLTKLVNAVGQRDGFEMSDADWRDWRAGEGQVVGQFLLDRDGIIRWTNIEGAREGLAGAGKFPSDEEFLAAARALMG